MKYLALYLWLLIGIAHCHYANIRAERVCSVDISMSYVERAGVVLLWPAATTFAVLNALAPVPPRTEAEQQAWCASWGGAA